MAPDDAGDDAPGLRIGVFGGTFDPPHIGHLIVIQDVADALELDRVLWVPAGHPPHKDTTSITPAEDRLELVRAATRGDRRFAVDGREVRRPGTSYTVDTLRGLRRERPEAAVHLVLGADQFQALHTWREPAEIARLARVAVMDRDGSPPGDGPRGLHVARDRVPVTRVDISSTAIRERLRSGRSATYLVPDAVLRIIEDKGLYTRGS